MSLADEIEKIVPKDPLSGDEHNNQLAMIEKIEDILKKLGISLETRFEIPLSSRIRPLQNENNA